MASSPMIHALPEEIAEIIEPQFPETDLDTITAIVKRYYDQDTWKENLVFGQDGFELLQDILEDAGELKERTQDLIYQLRNEDGTKSKQKTTDPKTGVKYERYGHLSDCLDYLLCYYLRDSWYKFKSGGDGNGYVVSTSVIQEGFSY